MKANQPDRAGKNNSMYGKKRKCGPQYIPVWAKRKGTEEWVKYNSINSAAREIKSCTGSIRKNTSRYYDISLTIPSGTPEKAIQDPVFDHN